MSKTLSKPMKAKLNSLLANTGDMALKRRARYIIEELELKDGDRVLDLGCGNGFYLHLLTNLGLNLKITGVDNDKNALEAAEANIIGKRVKLVLADVVNLRFKDSTFDKIILSEVIEHLEKEEPALKEIYRVLKPDGIFIVTTCNYNFPLFWDPVNWLLMRLFRTHIKEGFWAGIWNQHLRLYKTRDIEKLVKKTGFKIEKSETLTFWCLPFNHYLVNFAARLFYGGKLPQQISQDVDKFATSQRNWLIKTIFAFVNWADKLNDFLPRKNGVSIFVKARK